MTKRAFDVWDINTMQVIYFQILIHLLKIQLYNLL